MDEYKRVSRHLFVLIVGLLVSSISVIGQQAKIRAVENNLTESREIIFEDSLVPKFNIRDRMKFHKIPSVSMAIINNGKIEWIKTYGYADIGNKRLANNSTLYQVASISKSVVGLGMMKLVQDGQLSLSTDIRTYLKSWTFPDNEFSKGKPITLKNLLSHTAGLNVHGFIGYPIGDPIPTINQILNGEKPANHEAVKPEYPVNEHFEYSGGGYAIIRKILDDVISPNFDSLFQKIVLKPIGMENSSFSQPLSPMYKNYAYAHDVKMAPVKGHYYLYPELAAGGLWSTAGDIARFILSIQAALKADPKSIITKANCDEMLTPKLNKYALGFGIQERDAEKYFWHEGESFGYNAVFYGSFNSRKGIVILTNAYPDNGQPFIKELLNSVAITYNWKGIYNPVRKKLAKVPEKTLDQYIGEYVSDNPPIKITISKNGTDLLLTALRPEKMYSLNENSFFLASSPNDECVFSSSSQNGVFDILEVIQNGKTIIKAVRKKP